MKRGQLWAGILSPPIALGGIGVAIMINRPWWKLTDNAISDLGKVGLPYSWVMNVPLFISAILAIYYAAGLFGEVKNTVFRLGIALFIVGLFLLMGIAIFPEGTKPHYHVSWGFFLAGSIGYLTAGAGLWLKACGSSEPSRFCYSPPRFSSRDGRLIPSAELPSPSSLESLPW